MKIPQQIIENFIYANFSEVKRNENEFNFNTPFSKDGKKRLYVNSISSQWYDQKNQRGGSFDNFVSEYLDIHIDEVYSTLIKDYSNGMSLIYEQIEEEEKINTLELPSSLKLFKNAKSSIIVKQALKYLMNRKIPKKYIQKMGYVFDPSSEWNKRIFIPFYENNKLVYFIGRAFDNNTMRYKTPKGFDTKKFVFNIDDIDEEVGICEGVFDAMSVENIPTTALMSADIGTTQIQKIMDKGIKKIIMIPDKDETGNRTLLRNIEKILYHSPPSNIPRILIYNIPEPFKDFNEFRVKTDINSIDEKDCIYYNKKVMVLNSIFDSLANKKLP